nr:lectin-like protein [uncultured Mediterranean phage uvMED]BAR15311.1 lectin-like protein [uncultured Mediterranean phage uvMED]BAR15324.1 lectin-like protein [uncultured Mediterranean phage uvMED]
MANSYLNRTPSSAGNRKTFTFSTWIKRASSSVNQMLLVQSSNSSNFSFLRFKSNGTLSIASESGGSSQYNLVPSMLFRDFSAWYHIVLAVDTTQATSSNRIKLYVNGSQVTDFSTETYPSQNINTMFNSTNALELGRRTYATDEFFDGYMSHVAFVDGQALAPTVFGETDSTSGIWKFKSPSGVTWGTNGFHLKMENSAALGTDSSGNSNTFTVNGNLKQALDTPSNVYATFNPLDKSGGTVTTFSNGNTTTMHNSGNNGVVTASRSTLGYSSGKWYWEAKCIATGGDVRTGIISMSSTDYATNSNPFTLNEAYNYKQTGQKGSSGDTNVSYGASYTAGDIIGIAHDADNGTLAFYKNGVSQGNAFTSLSTSLTWGAFTTEYNTGKYDYNFGNGFFGTTAITSAGSNGNGSLFEYDVPSGYYALNTKNINTYG